MAALVQTVTGAIPAADLGTTLIHEHLLIDLWPWFDAPDSADGDAVAMAGAPVGPAIATAVRANPFAVRDNLVLDSVELAVGELAAFAAGGGRTVVDLTLPEIGRDPRRLREIAARTGLNVVMGTGHYIARAHPAALAGAPVEWLRDELIGELTDGVDGIRAGIIGEIGTSDPLEPAEERMLRAAAAAQRATGAGLVVHLDPWGRNAGAILDLVLRAGADPGRVVLSHLDPALPDLAPLRAIAARGASAAIDIWGDEDAYGGRGMPTDEARIAAVLAAADEGWIDRLAVSQDVCLKSQLRAFGGAGYDHLLRVIVPRLRRAGLDGTTIATLFVDNPRRVLAGPDEPSNDPEAEAT